MKKKNPPKPENQEIHASKKNSHKFPQLEAGN